MVGLQTVDEMAAEKMTDATKYCPHGYLWADLALYANNCQLCDLTSEKRVEILAELIAELKPRATFRDNVLTQQLNTLRADNTALAARLAAAQEELYRAKNPRTVEAVDVYPTHFGQTDAMVEQLAVALRPIVGQWLSEWRQQ
jgi:hypothetical protein